MLDVRLQVSVRVFCIVTLGKDGVSQYSLLSQNMNYATKPENDLTPPPTARVI